MAIDRQVIWVYRRHATYPHINPGLSFASAAEKAAMIADSCAVDPKTTKYFLWPHIQRVAAYTPP